MPLIEVVANSTKADKPGWAYVPDTGFDATKAPLQPGARKRHVRGLDNSDAGLSARQNAAIAKRLAELERDNSRDLAIPLPTRPRGKPRNPVTKKIIESQRSFAHYLADEEAAAGHSEQDTIQGKGRPGRPPKNQAQPSRLEKSLNTDVNRDGTDQRVGQRSSQGESRPSNYSLSTDESKLMQVTLPRLPSKALIGSLTTAPPLTWHNARAQPPNTGQPTRSFCELCGYWGRMRCLQCGARLCGLSCKRAHDEGRCQKYGG